MLVAAGGADRRQLGRLISACWCIVAIIAVADGRHDRLRRAEHRACSGRWRSPRQKGIPLTEAARAYADETRGTPARGRWPWPRPSSGPAALGRRPRRPAADGVGDAPGRRPGRTAGHARPGDEAAARRLAEADAALRDTIGCFVYLGVLLLASDVMTFMMLRIVPVFERMFQEFDGELPRTTQWVIDIGNLVVNYWSWSRC